MRRPILCMIFGHKAGKPRKSSGTLARLEQGKFLIQYDITTHCRRCLWPLTSEVEKENYAVEDQDWEYMAGTNPRVQDD